MIDEGLLARQFVIRSLTDQQLCFLHDAEERLGYYFVPYEIHKRFGTKKIEFDPAERARISKQIMAIKNRVDRENPAEDWLKILHETDKAVRRAGLISQEAARPSTLRERILGAVDPSLRQEERA